MTRGGKTLNPASPHLSVMSVKITRIGGEAFRAEADGFEVLSGRIDEQTPPSGMSPGRLLAASLGLCSGIHASWFLKRNGIEASTIQIKVDAMNDKEPSRAAELSVEIRVGANLSPKQVEGLMAEMRRCYVGNTLRSAPRLTYTIK